MSYFMPFSLTELVIHIAVLQLAIIRGVVLHYKGKKAEDTEEREFYSGKVKQSRTIIVSFLLLVLIRATVQFYPQTPINQGVIIPFVSVASLLGIVTMELLIGLLFMNFAHEKT